MQKAYKMEEQKKMLTNILCVRMAADEESEWTQDWQGDWHRGDEYEPVGGWPQEWPANWSEDEERAEPRREQGQRKKRKRADHAKTIARLEAKLAAVKAKVKPSPDSKAGEALVPGEDKNDDVNEDSNEKDVMREAESFVRAMMIDLRTKVTTQQAVSSVMIEATRKASLFPGDDFRTFMAEVTRLVELLQKREEASPFLKGLQEFSLLVNAAYTSVEQQPSFMRLTLNKLRAELALLDTAARKLVYEDAESTLNATWKVHPCSSLEELQRVLADVQGDIELRARQAAPIPQLLAMPLLEQPVEDYSIHFPSPQTEGVHDADTVTNILKTFMEALPQIGQKVRWQVGR